MSAIEVSCDPARLDIKAVHDLLKNSYWAEGMPFEVIKKACENCLCFGAYDGSKQVAIARVVTDRATYAYLTDVMVSDAYRGQGIGKKLMESILKHPDLQGLRRFALFTKDAHELYRKFGFKDCVKPECYLEIYSGNPYLPAQKA